MKNGYVPNVSIYRYEVYPAVVAAGAVVTRDVLPFTVVGGIPAKNLKTTEEHLVKS